MKNVYLYPVPVPGKTGVNPYMSSLSGALKQHYHILNEHRPSNLGILGMIRYLRRADMVYLNWVEELSDLRLGRMQSIMFLVILRFLKLFRIRILWTLHNKQSHWERRAWLKNLLFRQMLKKSDLILTHAKDGLDIVPDGTPCLFLHHPVRITDSGIQQVSGYSYDLIIWGNIAPYKGVDTFLEYLSDQGVLNDYRILVAGKITSDHLRGKLHGLTSGSDSLILLDQFVPEHKLWSLIRASRLVIFTYHSDSVLSSGALMDSLSQTASILGPDTGAFRDLSELGLINTYKDYPELLQKINYLLGSGSTLKLQKEKIEDFNRSHSWENFAAELYRFVTSATF